MFELDSTGHRQDQASHRRRILLRAVLCGVVLPASFASSAQQQPKVWRIGFLASDSSSTRVYEGFRQGMRELGYVEAKNFIIEWRFADGKYERLPSLAAELVRRNVDVIVAATTLSVQSAHQATATSPIVMVAVPDPIGEGFASSLSRPGGNITGLTNIVTEISVKHLELLRIAVPRLSRVAVLINPLNPSDSLILEQIQGAAFSIGVRVFPVEASTARQIEAGFEAMIRERTQALIVAADSYFDVQRDQIAKLAVESRLPAISSNREMTEAGALMSYGQDLGEHYRRAATYVDKILKGAKPGDLPIEQPTVLGLIINRKTARALGLAIPQELVLRADRVIE
ncbi:MAG TPA: ABC transporter substrate-binding protein [Casimicrobiaceae bacterium]|jgi:putative ABC transport system substrate-binding protein|nr:ABC transporter substrate-binding protein [Casimicrobiaceae bacterium]